MLDQTTYPDYKAIVNELMKGCPSENSSIVSTFPGSRPISLKEFRTISISGPRQSGKTKFIIDLFKQYHHDTVIFTINKFSANFMATTTLDKYPELGMDTILKSIYPHLALKKHVEKKPENSELVKAPKFIIVDEASHHLCFFSKTLYKWIAETADPDPFIILIG